MNCIHHISLLADCESCRGKAEDGGWDGHGWRIVDPNDLRSLDERVAEIERWIEDRESYEREQREV